MLIFSHQTFHERVVLMKHYLYAIALIICMFCLASCAISNASTGSDSDEGFIQRSYEIEDHTTLDLSSFAGKVEIFAWNKKAVSIEITKRSSVKDENSRQKLFKNIKFNELVDSGKIIFSIVFQGSKKDEHECNADIRIFLPREEAILNVELHRGSLSVFDDFEGVLTAKLGNVDTKINNFFGVLNITGDSGNINVSNGRIDDNTSIEQKAGNIKIKADLIEGGVYSFSTAIGNVNLSFPHGRSIEIRSVGNLNSNEFSSLGAPAVVNVICSIGKINLEKFLKK